MTRVQLRPIRTEAEEREFYRSRYPSGYKHDVWPDHVERVAASVESIRRYSRGIRTAADLSCGDAAILRGLAASPDVGLTDIYLGDLNGVQNDAALPGPWRQHQRAVGVSVIPGGLPDSLWGLPEREPPVDLIVLSETLEHVPDPDGLLRSAAHFSRYLFLSTPLDEPVGSGNLEHYWGWGQGDVHEMLWESGWSPLEVHLFTPESTRHYADAYTFQLWMAVHR